MIYHTRSLTWNLDRAKAPGFNDRKRVHISNIDPFAIVESRELSRGPKSKFATECGIRLIFLLLLFLTSCESTTPSSSQRHQRQQLSLNIFSEVPSLDPHQAIDAQSHNVLMMLFEPLTRRSADGKIVPGAAQSYEVSEDGLTYTFHMRPAVWSNGDPVTADDFLYAWRANLNPRSLGEEAYHMYVIRGAKASAQGLIAPEEIAISAPDDKTLKVELEHPAPYFLELVQVPSFFPTHKKTSESHSDWALEAGPLFVTNGPFLMDSWNHHNQITLVRNPNYWDAANVRLNKIEMMMVGDSTTELALFEKEALDWTGRPISPGIPPEALRDLATAGKVEFHPIGVTYFYMLNVEIPPLDNIKMRKALAYAINRRVMVDSIMKMGDLTATCAVPPSLAVRSGGYFQDANIVEARRLFSEALKEMGLSKDELPPITINYNTTEINHKVAQAIQQQWKVAFGIDVSLSNMEWKVYIDNMVKGNFMVARAMPKSWYTDPKSLLDMFKHEDRNFTRWRNKRFIAMLDEALYEKNEDRRCALYSQAEELLMDEMPAIPLFFPTADLMRHPDLKNVYLSPLGDIDFRHAYFQTN